ncbi:MAG: TAT-variant-translocated molybdopterin oxidoreductase [Verrucomicrobia bacterium]|nr:TAT-variant-translocated molybdopterin oxidoreductase [Verrucomicrobiota bacterium]
MKTIPPTCTEPEVGPKYWRSLDDLAETPEFREWVDREFPAGASEFTDPVSRRNFVKIMSASFLLAGLGLTGCRKPEEYILPFGKQPEGYIHGLPQFYATARPTRGSAVPLLVRSHEGRPIKVEGNPNHPGSNGGSDRYTQASILNLYDPDRAMRFAKSGSASSRVAAFEALTQISKQFSANGGAGLAFLLDRSSSPSRERLQSLISKKFPKAQWFIHEPVEFNVVNEAASIAAGQSVKAVYHYDKASRIVSLDCDFVGAEEDAFRNIAGFASGRKLRNGNTDMNRLYLVEGLFSLTAQNADHRLRVAPSQVAAVAAKLLAAIGGESSSEVQTLAGQYGGDEKWIAECARDLAANKGKSLVVAGSGQPLAVHLLAFAINQQLGSVGSTLTFIEQKEVVKSGSIDQLATALNAGQVDTLVVSGVNPVYTAPAELDWAKTQAKAKTVVRLSYYEDESFAGSTWHFPAAHYLESWGDARTGDGTVVSIQPLIEPLFGGVTELEVLARIAGLDSARPYDVVRDTIKDIAGSGDFEENWKRFLHDGLWKGSAPKAVNAKLSLKNGSRELAGVSSPAPTQDKLEVVFHRDYSVDDGRYNNNGWLQELPDPITKIVWDNAILLSPATAKQLGVDVVNHENANLQVPLVKISLNGREVEGPAWIQPGLADNIVGMALGYGRENTGRIGQGTGYNAYRLLPGNARRFASGAKLTNTGKTHLLVVTQDHGSMRGRPIIREATLDQYEKRADFVKALDLQEPPGGMRSMYPNPLDARKDQALHQWGMVIDLTSCVGCNSCAIACQSENNVPIVGKDQVGRGREMHWLRLDRYFAGTVEDPQMVTQPMLCQHCEAAPCESVCPVNATVHDEEGLNLMVYNRCVGTRYCSNNCPYKVRRFNFFDYNKRTLKELKGPWYPTPMINKVDGEWGMTKWLKDPDKGWRTGDDWDLYKMAKNPDVTVRMRGVMEKCTFCVQRLQQAKIAQKVKAGASGDVRVKESEGTMPKVACQQACPADAIVFGDISDPESQVAKLKQEPRNYSVLEFLLTKPRLTYLAKIRNPNPSMPDAYEHPFTIGEYQKNNHSEGQNPFEKHGPDTAHGETKGTH